jgi:uncharacterized protein (DUF58 family)
MQTLIPNPVTAPAHPNGRFGRVLGFGLTPRALLLLLAGLLDAIPAFFHPHRLWLMFAWDALVALLIALDATRLPAPEDLAVTRRFVHSPAIGLETEIAYTVHHEAGAILSIALTDELHPSVLATPRALRLTAYPREAASVALTLRPRERGDAALGRIFLRYRSALALIERWAVADTAQRIRIYPAVERASSHTDLYLMRARQIELQKRRLRMKGLGRDFESLRDFQRGDELRNISWTATARRARLIAREFTTERSQQVWVVLDAGRLSRTAFHLRAEDVTVTQLDQAASAAVMLAQVIGGSGDKFALLTYGRVIQQQLPPGNGPAHLRMLIDLLSQTRAERSEANHLGAVSRLKQLQRRRGLILWIAEMTDSIGRPEVVAAAVELVRRHLVVLVLLKHPELDRLAADEPKSVEAMFARQAAQEILDRREEAIAKLRQQGVLVVETTPGEVGVAAINKYLEVKAEGLL